MGIPQEHVEQLIQCLEEERFQDAKELIEDLLKIDINNHNLYYLKAIACIRMNKLDEALIDLGEVAYLNATHVPSMHALAFLFLKKGDFGSAVNKWITIQTVSPNDDLAKANINLVKEQKLVKERLNQYHADSFIPLDYKAIRKALSFKVQSNVVRSVEKKALTTLQDISLEFDSHHKKPQKRSFLTSINWKSLIVILFFVACIVLAARVILDDKKTQDVLSKKTGAFKYFLSKFPIQFSYTQEEIQKQKTIILSLVKANKYNQSYIAMNKFYYSNASRKDKDTVHMWEGMLSVPEKPSDLDFKVNLTDALKNPSIYQNIYWASKGIVSNVKKYVQYMTFTFNNKEKDIYINSLDLSSNIDNGDHVELFGKLTMNKDQSSLELEAYQLKLLPPENPSYF